MANVWSIGALARELGRDRRTVSTALRDVPADGELPGGHKGWTLRTALAALNDRHESQTERLRRAQAEKVELEVAQIRGELVSKSEAQDAIIFAFTRVRARFLALPTRMAAQMAAAPDPRVAESALRRAVNDVLDDLSATTPERIMAEQEELTQ